MKKFLLSILIVVVAAGAAPAGSPRLAGPTTAEYVYVTNPTGGTSGVTVLKQASPATNAPIFVKTINDPSFNGAYDIAAVASRRRLYVTNSSSNPGTITVINGDTLTVDTVFNVPQSQNLKGISISADDASIFVAGQTTTAATPTNSPAVWQVDLGTGVATVAGSILDAGNAAVDCAIVEASAVGGTGNGPGKLYFSVPTSGTGYIGIVDIVSTGSPPQIIAGTGALSAVTAPTRMALSPDHTVLFASCDNLSGPPTPARDTFLHLIRIQTSTNGASDVQVQTIVRPLPFTSLDVSFRPELSPMRAYVLGNNNGAYNFNFVDSAGTVIPSPVGINPPPTPVSVVHHLDGAGNDFLYYGDTNPTSTTFGRFNVANWATAAQLATGTSGASVPTRFAFMTQPPAPLLFTVCPKGNANAANMPFEVHGANFQPGALIQMPGASAPLVVPMTFVNGNTLQGQMPILPFPPENDVTVINPDTQSALLHQYYTACNPALSTFTLALPSLEMGYGLFSLPQYTAVSTLRAALVSTLGPYNPVFYRVFFWVGGQYVELPDMTDDCDLAGRAFWVLTRFGAQVTVSGLDCYTNRGAGGTRVVPLDPGWNLISLPYQNGAQIHMNWGVVNVTADGAAWTGASAVTSSALMNPNLFDFAGGTYVSTGVLISGTGYWAFNATSGTVYLLFSSANVFRFAGGPAPTSTALSAGSIQPPGPPGGVSESPSSKKSSCALLGPEILLLALFLRVRPRRRLGA